MLTSTVQIIYFIAAVGFIIASFINRKGTVAISVFISVAGVLMHAFAIITRGMESQKLPLTDTYETLLLLSFIIIIFYLFLLGRYRLIWVGAMANLFAAFILAASSLVRSAPEPLLPSLASNWLLLHVATYFFAYASFALAFGMGIACILIKVFYKKQDLLEFFDIFIYRLITIGFPFLTLGLCTGAVWANVCWGRYWNWDAKEVWAFVTWLIYAACLHMRHSRNLRGMAAVVLAVSGFLAVLFTYLGVNLWLATVHAYA